MKKKSALIVLVILALGVIGTSLSALYEQVEFIPSLNQPTSTVKVSNGFPLTCHGYSYFVEPEIRLSGPSLTYWFSLGPLLVDAVFWFAISFFVCLAIVRSATAVRKAASKILSVINVVVIYFFASLSFLVVGLGLCSVTQTVYAFGPPGPNGISGVATYASHPYLDLGLRLFGFGIFLVVATFYQTLVREKEHFRNTFPQFRNMGLARAGRFIRLPQKKRDDQ
jgi:hypothetical protein